MSGDAFQAAADGKITIPDFSDLITNKLKFPVKFVGSEALAEDIAATTTGLKEVIEKTK